MKLLSIREPPLSNLNDYRTFILYTCPAMQTVMYTRRVELRSESAPINKRWLIRLKRPTTDGNYSTFYILCRGSTKEWWLRRYMKVTRKYIFCKFHFLITKNKSTCFLCFDEESFNFSNNLVISTCVYSKLKKKFPLSVAMCGNK
jgi:hypothetical protein